MKSKRQTFVTLLLLGAVVVLIGLWISRRNSVAIPSKGEWWAIQDATILSMDPKLPESFKGTVLCRGNTIVEVGARLKLKEDVRVVSGLGKVLTPGIALAGTRLGVVEISLEGSTKNDAMPSKEPLRPAFRVFDGFNYNSSLIPIARVEGITSVMVQPFGGLISGQSAMVDLFGHSEQMLVRSPLAVHAAIPSGRSAFAWLKLRQAMKEAKLFSMYSSQYQRRKLRKLHLSELDLEALSQVVKRKIPMVIEVNRAADIRTALRFADEYNIKIVLSGVAEGWQVGTALAQAKVPVLVGPPHNLPSRFDRLGSRYDNAALLHQAKVQIAFSARGGAHNIRAMRHEAGIAVAWGLPTHEAIKALTSNVYSFFGLDKRYGSLQRGKLANMVLWSGDPLELSTRALHVWIRGKEVPMVSRQTLLRDRYKNLKTLFRLPNQR
ncbi:MAG: hypothetical protein EP343_33225 [Deltaproteobacteria bacterium]|nr:MAG: hypothetical protein EP343_33225 [Deltaproteobacteria bacterium]